MLVVADELAVGVGGEGGLAGAGEAEEHGGVARGADVGGAVHGEHAHLGQDVVHDGEDGLLDLACVLAAGDDDHLFLIVHQDGGLGTGAVDLGDALEAGGGDDGEVSGEILQLLGGGAAEELMDKEILAGQLVDDAEALGVLGVRAGKAVENEDFLVLEVGHHLVVNGVVLGLVDGAVHLAPGDLVMNGGGVHDKLVVGAAAGVLAGLHHQGAGIGELTLAAAQSVLGELGGSEVAVNCRGIDDAQSFQTVGFHSVVLLEKSGAGHGTARDFLGIILAYFRAKGNRAMC